jgi:hypothetical protein
MNKYIIGFIGFIIIIALAVVFLGSQAGLFGKKAVLQVKTTKIQLSVADTEAKREIGLSGRSSLSDTQGMLFIFDSPTVPLFWMKGMKFPIDIIFLKDKKIVTIYKNAPAPKSTTEIPTTFYQPASPIDSVIELKAGASDTFNLREGDALKLTL